MSNLVSVASFPTPYEAHIAQAKLQEHGIESSITDEISVQIYANAIGGIRVQVKEEDFAEAKKIIEKLSFEK
ncbi:MAG: DUF2007 domain-containing protein [Bacteroidales bacterium]